MFMIRKHDQIVEWPVQYHTGNNQGEFSPFIHSLMYSFAHLFFYVFICSFIWELTSDQVLLFFWGHKDKHSLCLQGAHILAEDKVSHHMLLEKCGSGNRKHTVLKFSTAGWAGILDKVTEVCSGRSASIPREGQTGEYLLQRSLSSMKGLMLLMDKTQPVPPEKWWKTFC